MRGSMSLLGMIAIIALIAIVAYFIVNAADDDDLEVEIGDDEIGLVEDVGALSFPL